MMLAPVGRSSRVVAVTVAVASWLGCAGQDEPGDPSRAQADRGLAHAMPGTPATRPAASPGALPGASSGLGTPLLPATANTTAPAPAPAPPATAPATAPARRITIMAVGDVLFGRYLDRKTYAPVVRAEHDDPFVEVAPILRRADLALANIESPVLHEPDEFGVNSRMTFRAEPADLARIEAAGFDIVSFANNHALNFGVHGVRESLAHVGRTGLRPVGVGLDQAQADAPAVVEVGGVRVAVLGRTTWLNGRLLPRKNAAISFVSDQEMQARLAADVRALRDSSAADVVIVFIHWGREGAARAGNHQRWAAQAMIDAGAHLVIGHHPHVVQEIERYGNGLIAYSLGNFLFDNGHIHQRRTVILEAAIEVEGGVARVADVELHPVLMELATHLPRLARGRDHRIWARLLAGLAPGIRVAADPGNPVHPAEPALLGP
jgi:poly-gamma-glutamate capsule biosynthesis protein CapA/YwtB (metallophosphatase superfamily)